MSTAGQPWYQIMNVEEIPSPALLLFPDRVESNIQGMLERVGGDAERLCPHVKTVKTEAIIRMMVRSGIKQFKCATIAEGETAIKAGAASVLLAIQPTTCNAKRWINLAKAHPDRDFGTIIDCKESIESLSELSKQHRITLKLWIDLNIGMNRTGILPGEEAVKLGEWIHSHVNVELGGIHAYDGHLHQSSIQERILAFQIGRIRQSVEKKRIRSLAHYCRWHPYVSNAGSQSGIHLQSGNHSALGCRLRLAIC